MAVDTQAVGVQLSVVITRLIQSQKFMNILQKQEQQLKVKALEEIIELVKNQV